MGKKKVAISIVLALIIIFVLLSGFNGIRDIKSSEAKMTSTSLTLNESTDGNVTTYEYVDSEGELTLASDKGWARMLRTVDDEGRTTREEYYDELGAPAYLWAEYCAYSIEYGELQRIYRYYDEHGNLAERKDGFSVIVRTYDSDEYRDHIDYYYDSEMNHTQNTNQIFGIHRYYDSSWHNLQDIYLDAQGNQMSNKNGNASLIRTYDEYDRVIREMYYDIDGNPAIVTDGYAGISYIRDNETGDILKLTYLNSEGNPIVTNKGYASILYTRAADSSIITERYFDSEDNPIKVGKSWYGKKHVGDKAFYLSKNGNVIFSIDSLLSNYPFIVIVMGLIVSVIFLLRNKNLNYVLFALYFLFIMYETIFFRVQRDRNIQLELFWSYKQFFTDNTMRLEILNNIWLFIPYGVGIALVLKRKKWILFTALLPIVIEISQAVFKIGLCETDDVISNTLGILIGLFVAYYINSFSHKKQEKV